MIEAILIILFPVFIAGICTIYIVKEINNLDNNKKDNFNDN